MPLWSKHLIAAAACTFVLIAASPEQSATSQIEVVVVNCAKDASVAPTLRLVAWPNPGDDANNFTVKELSATPTAEAGVFTASLTETVNNYSIGASTPHCQTRKPAEIPLYASHTRHVVLALSAICCAISNAYPGSIAISAPQGVGVLLFAVSGGKSFLFRRGTLDSDVTYFADIEPGSYQIVLEASGGVACVPVVVPQTFHATQEFIAIDLAGLPLLFRNDARCKEVENSLGT